MPLGRICKPKGPGGGKQKEQIHLCKTWQRAFSVWKIMNRALIDLKLLLEKQSMIHLHFRFAIACQLQN